MNWTDTLSRLGLALLLTFPIGWEREAHQKTAGLRTHLLVSLGCCLFMLISLQVTAVFGSQRADPGRIAAQVVTGIGFLGGGAILRGGGVVRGMTTAASIWSVAAIGMACGAGYLPGALAGALGTYLVLTFVERWEQLAFQRRVPMTVRVRVRGDEALRRVRELIDALNLQPERLSVESEGGERVLLLSGLFSPRAISLAFDELSQEADVIGMERQSL